MVRNALICPQWVTARFYISATDSLGVSRSKSSAIAVTRFRLRSIGSSKHRRPFPQLQAPLRTNGSTKPEAQAQVIQGLRAPANVLWTGKRWIHFGGCKNFSLVIFARHMRKVLRIHEKGYSNQQVLQQAGIHVVSDIECRVLSQSASLALDTCRSPQLQVRECKRAEHLQQQFYRVKEISEQRIDSMLLEEYSWRG